MLTEDEIVSTLEPLNGTHYRIDDVRAYARKLLSRGKFVCTRLEGEVASYVLFYDNGPEAFISMVWTNPRMLHRGLASNLLDQIIRRTPQSIALEVNSGNIPALCMYRKLGFERISTDGLRERWVLRRRVAIMQPYFYPWVGYLQLIDAADFFVFYDDVHFIRRGRINRNNILVNGKEHGFTIPIKDASQNNLILETKVHELDRWRGGFLRQLNHCYKKAPFFADAIGVIESALDTDLDTIADLAIASISGVLAYIGKPLNFARSSEFSPGSRGMEKSRRLLEITKQAGGSRYINTPGGRALYDKSRFVEQGVQLSFLEPVITEYRQFGGSFVPGLSVIDMMMFNHPDKLRKMMGSYGVD